MGRLYSWQVYQCLPITSPRVPQYPLKKEALKRLQVSISKFLKNSILSPCNSPCNTPMLAVRNSDDTYRLVQDLRAINQAVIPHSPYSFKPLGTPESNSTGNSMVYSPRKKYSVLEKKMLFFCIPVHPDLNSYLPLNGMTKTLNRLSTSHMDSAAPGVQRQSSLIWPGTSKGPLLFTIGRQKLPAPTAG